MSFFGGWEGLNLLQITHKGQRHLDRYVEDSAAFLVLQAIQEALHRPGRASSGPTLVKFDAKAQVELEKSAAKRKAVPADLLGSASE